MPRAVARRGADQVATEISFQLLWHEVTVRVDDEAAERCVRALANTAAQPVRPSRTQRYEVAAAPGGGYLVSEEDDALTTAATAELACAAVAQRCRLRALELASLKGWASLRAALVDVAGRRLLLAGPPERGGALLALLLALGGGSVQGGERVLLRDGVALALPWPLRLSVQDAARIERLRPAARAGAGQAERGRGDAGPPARLERTLAIDPARQLGLDWVLSARACDEVIALDPRPGAAGCRPRTAPETLTDLIGLAEFPTRPARSVLDALVTLLAPARCHRLFAAAPEEMERALRRLSC